MKRRVVRKNADDRLRRIERQIASSYDALPATLVDEYFKETKRIGRYKNKLAAQGRILADAITSQADQAGQSGLGTEYRTTWLADELGWHNTYVSYRKRNYNIRSNLAKAIQGGLERNYVEIILRAFNYDIPVAEWSPGGEDLGDMVSNWNEVDSGEVVVVYRQRVRGYPRGEPDTEKLVGVRVMQSWHDGPHVWKDRQIEVEDFENGLYQHVAIETDTEVEDVVAAAETPIGFGQLVWDYTMLYAVETDEVFEDLARFKQRFCLELAYEAKRWLK